MIDFHSHILPKMDDGSRNVEESIAMLESLAKQGIDTVVATPHFYANDESVSDFIIRRNSSFEKLKVSLTSQMPEILLGAEIKYYEGISHLENLDKLCVQNSNLLLLEMPFKRWTEYLIRELVDISCSGKYVPVIAHVERYMKFQQRDVIEYLLNEGVLFQINSSFVYEIFTKRKALGLLKNRAVHFLGSDCHNMSDRLPDIGKAYEIINKKLGRKFTEDFNCYVNNFLK